MSATTTAHTGNELDNEHHAHVTPIKILVGVYVALIGLTAITVAVTQIDLGSLNIWAALFIAAAKAAVVAAFYMHLKYENPFFGQILIGAFFFVALFIGLALLDTREYAETMDPPTLTSASP